jgi:hypothetical protein
MYLKPQIVINGNITERKKGKIEMLQGLIKPSLNNFYAVFVVIIFIYFVLGYDVNTLTIFQDVET